MQIARFRRNGFGKSPKFLGLFGISLQALDWEKLGKNLG